MKTYKQDGYIFITVAVIVIILISTLTIAISKQNKKIELIQNYEQLMTIEEEISAIELVITEYLNNNFNKNKNLTKNYGFQEQYETPSQATIEVKISSNDNCFNVNSLFYKNSNNPSDFQNQEIDLLVRTIENDRENLNKSLFTISENYKIIISENRIRNMINKKKNYE